MSGETSITITGNLTNNPELRSIPVSRGLGKTDGTPVANFTIASTPRVFDSATREWKDGETLFLRATAWGKLGEHAAASLTKGSRVVATGDLKPRSYETKTGEKRTVIEFEIEEIGVSLKHAAVPREFTKAEPATAETAGSTPAGVETAGAETGSGAPSGEDPDAPVAAGRAERRAREFTISPRLYTGEDVWFGRDANPSGRVELPATPAVPEW
ncbi:single-stranded DNA-binding protein (plasmid) [Arthrobacter sp. FW305-BF8]|uniref:single-stranded DNA-binding protein n=1 Tax=Arthrobacter sp. FW305-BF8 TaxID=2879617 RepID=UPI001F02229B|nr:single-stranded DNA-binding protein [Arthrobacter sp. FW305-BF8]UKA56669.1 single-stranded DNA-binding protein [Arthrobacter sp. FW305-BF8]